MSIVSDLGPVEFLLLKIIWGLGEATAGEILEAYNKEAARPLAYTTVSTILGRLEAKKVVEADKKRQPYTFKAVVNSDQLLRQRVKDFVQTFFGGEPLDLALRLVAEQPLTDESLQQLEAAVKKKRSARKSGRK